MFKLEQSLLDEIKQLPFWGDTLSVVPVNQQGLSNSAFRLSCEDKDYFLKAFDSNNFVLLDRGNLFDVQQALAQHTLAPAGVYLDPQHRFQIDDWIEGENLFEARVPIKQKLTVLARTLAFIHVSVVEAPPLNLKADWLHYFGKIGLEHSKYLFDQFDDFEHQYQQMNENVLCHNDLSIAHCHVTKARFAFDWEYAATGNRFFDIASCIEINKLDDEECEFLLLEYWRETQHLSLPSRYSEAQVTENVQKMRPIVIFTNDLWMLASQS